jgi:hypothetical protein
MAGGINPSVRATDTFASHIRQINQRLATLERAASAAGGGGGTPGDTVTQFWNSAWGVVTKTEFPATTTGSTAAVTLATASATLYAGRRYRITAEMRAWSTSPNTVSGGLTFAVTGPFITGAQNAHDQYITATGYAQAEWSAVINCTADTASAVYAATAACTVAATYYGGLNSGLTIEDVGPIIQIATSPPPAADWSPFDARYVNVAGDTMIAPLTITGASSEKLKIATDVAAAYAYIGFYDELNARHGWLGKLASAAGPMYYVSDGVLDLNLIAGGTLNLQGGSLIQMTAGGVSGPSLDADSFNIPATHYLDLGSTTRQMIGLYGGSAGGGYGIGVQGSTWYARSGSTFSFHRGGVHDNAANTPGGTGVENMRLGSVGLYVAGSADVLRLHGSGAASYIGFYCSSASIAAPPTRSGYIGFSSATALLINNEVASGYLYLDHGASGGMIIREGGVEQARFDSAGILNIGRTSNGAYYTDAGSDLRPAGQTLMTASTVNSYPWLIRTGAALAAGQRFISFRTATSGVGSEIGHINMATTTTTAYSTTSDKRFKANVRDIDDDDALARLKKWRPVAFQWKLDDDGQPSIDGEPRGEVHHGFLAQDLAKVQPHAVQPGHGTWKQLLAFRRRHRAWQDREARRKRERPDDQPERFDEMDPFAPWGGDWSIMVPDLVAATQALVRRVEAQDDELRELRKLLPKH